MNIFTSIKKNYIDPIFSFERPAQLFLWMTIIDGIILSGWQLFFNFYMIESGFGRDFLGILTSVPSLAGLIFGIPIGKLSDKLGRKPSIMIGITFASMAMIGQVTFQQPAIIILMAFLAGLFNMLFLVSLAPLMMKLSDQKNRTLLFSLNYGLQTIAGAIGSVFASQLPKLFGSILDVSATSATAYQAVLMTSVLLGMTALIPAWLMDEPITPQASPEAGSTQQAPSTPLTLIAKLAAPNLLIGFGAAILIPYMNVFLRERFSASDSLIGLLFSLSSLFIGVASLIGPRLSVRLGGKVRAVAMTQFGSLVFLMTIGFTPFLWLASISFLLRAALMNMAAPLYSAFCMEQTPEKDQGLVNSVLNISWQMGWAIGPYLSGLVQESYGFTPLFIATGILYSTSISLLWTFFHKTEQKPIPA
jgi:MFS family permease